MTSSGCWLPDSSLSKSLYLSNSSTSSSERSEDLSLGRSEGPRGRVCCDELSRSARDGSLPYSYAAPGGAGGATLIADVPLVTVAGAVAVAGAGAGAGVRHGGSRGLKNLLDNGGDSGSDSGGTGDGTGGSGAVGVALVCEEPLPSADRGVRVAGLSLGTGLEGE